MTWFFYLAAGTLEHIETT